MKTPLCREFQDWLDHLPDLALSKELKIHLETCPECRKKHAQYEPVIKALMDVPRPEKLSEAKIQKIISAAKKEGTRRENRMAALSMGIILALTLPIIGLLNWLLIRLGSHVLTDLLTAHAGQVYIILYLLAASLAAAAVLGSIPLLWGYLRKNPIKEC